MDLLNDTPFAAERALFLDSTGRERLLVVLKATFSVASGRPTPADEQLPVATADAYRDDPARSSLLEPCDLVPFKPATDVLVRGCAYTSDRDRTSVLAAFRLGPIKKGVRVLGDRVWERTLGLSSKSAPEPFAKMELTWERAFGGTDESTGRTDHCEENPVGVGFRGRGSQLPVAGTPLPNVEDPVKPLGSPGDRPPPAGFGPLAPHWRQRARYAGTYDEAWRTTRHPFLPQDFDPRFHQVAPPDQIYPSYVQGGEPVKAAGMTPDRPIEFALPTLHPRVAAMVGDMEEAMAGVCDTVILDCEKKTVSLVWRASLVVHGRVPRVRWIQIEAGGTDAA
jgi:hypothetical protein